MLCSKQPQPEPSVIVGWISAFQAAHVDLNNYT